jgi:CTP:molybdopterin cytidylyltransferase MocA
MKKPVAALLLARGPAANSWQALCDVKYKALVPINGIPMVEFVVNALQQSMVERIFIVQGADRELEKALPRHDKNVFVDCDPSLPSYSYSLFHGLEQLTAYYGREELESLDVMMTPCDVPLVRSEGFNRLIEAHSDRECDVCLAMIKQAVLKEKYPQRYFFGFKYHDLGEAYCIQNFAFLNGSSLATAYLGEDRRNRDRINDFARTTDYLVSSKDSSYLAARAWVELLRRLMSGGHLMECLTLLARLSSGSYTTSDGRRFLYLVSSYYADYIESEEAELSYDIDEPGHLDSIPELTGAVCRHKVSARQG